MLGLVCVIGKFLVKQGLWNCNYNLGKTIKTRAKRISRKGCDTIRSWILNPIKKRKSYKKKFFDLWMDFWKIDWLSVFLAYIFFVKLISLWQVFQFSNFFDSNQNSPWELNCVFFHFHEFCHRFLARSTCVPPVWVFNWVENIFHTSFV